MTSNRFAIDNQVVYLYHVYIAEYSINAKIISGYPRPVSGRYYVFSLHKISMNVTETCTETKYRIAYIYSISYSQKQLASINISYYIILPLPLYQNGYTL